MSLGFGLSLPAYPVRGGGGNNPFNQLGPTLDLAFAGIPTDPLGAATLTDYTLNTNFIVPQYQIAAQYVVWENGVGLVNKNFSDIITFTRASTATYFDSSGVLQTAGNNVPRFDYNPATLAAQGLLIEEQRTNSIRNNTMQGAVAGTPGTLPTNWNASGLGTLTQTVVGTGTQNGINYVDVRFNGTTSTTQLTLRFEQTGIIAAANGQSWALSSWLSFVAGSLTNITSPTLGNNLFDAGAVYIGEGPSLTFTLTSTFTRYTAAGAISNASTASIRPYFYILFNSGVAIDITLRIGMPQMEQGAFATSVIPTTTTALTRSADVASVNTLSPWFNASEGTLYVQGILVGGTSGAFPRQAAFVGSNPNNDSIGVYWLAPSGNMAGNIRTAGVGELDQSILPAKTAGSMFKVAVAYKTNDANAASDGNVATTDTTVTLPTIQSLRIGGQAVFQPTASSWLQRIAYYPRRLSNAELQTLTT